MAKKIVLVRNSERQSYKRCRQRWWWSYVERNQPKNTSKALRFGDLVHQALEAYYIPGRKRGPHPAKTFTHLYQEQLKVKSQFGYKDDEGEWVDAGVLGVAILEHYVETYGPEKHIEILLPEMAFQYDLTNPKNGKYVCTAVGKLDIVYRDHNMPAKSSIGLMDHKTAASISTTHLALDEQAGTYWAVAPLFLRQKGLLADDQDIAHILYNFIRKAAKDERPRNAAGLYLNKDGSVSKKQPPPYFQREKVYRDDADRENILRRIMMEAWEMEQVKKGKLPVYKHPTRDCSWDCPFVAPCELHETGSDHEELLQLDFVKWDPYADHELYTK